MEPISRVALSVAPQGRVEGGASRKRRLSLSSDTSVEEDTKNAAQKAALPSPLRRAVSVPVLSAKREEEPPKTNRDKKRRRKKKRKVSVVQGSAEKEGEVSRSPSHARRQPSISATAEPVASVAGPSTSRIPSLSLTATSTTQNSAISDLEPTPTADKILGAPTNTDKDNEVSGQDSLATLTYVDKGKGKAITEDAVHTTTDTLASPSTVANQLSAHQAMLDSLLPSVTCRICYFLMHRPFALSPCGHVACHSCLVNWFSQANPPQSQGLPDIPVLRRKKTCPHCRAVVTERPVEVWALKETIASLVKSGLLDKDLISSDHEKEEANAGDPWKDIFHPVRQIGNDHGVPPNRDLLGIEDHEDGGVYRCIDCMHEIWDGLCSGCHREYPLHRELFGGIDSDSDTGSTYGEGNDYHPVIASLLRTLGAGPPLGYDNSETDSLSDSADDDALVENGGLLWTADEDGVDMGSDDDESYEGSFIDDGDIDVTHDGGPHAPEFSPAHHVRPEDEVEVEPPLDFPPIPRRHGRISMNPVVILSDDEEGSPSRRSGSHRGDRIIISDDEDEGGDYLDDDGASDVEIHSIHADEDTMSYHEDSDDSVDDANMSLQHPLSDGDDNMYYGSDGYDYY